MAKGLGAGGLWSGAAAALVICGGFAWAQAPGQGPGQPAGQVMIRQAGDRFENVIETADGALYATATFGGKVMRRGRDGAVSVFFATPNPQGVLQLADGRFVVDFQDRVPDMSTGRLSLAGLGAHLVVLDRVGKVEKSLAAPDAKAFFNGMALYGRDTVFISDTGGDRILKANLATGAVEVWLDADRTKPSGAAASGGGPGGANGMKVHDGWVYFSHGDVYRVRIGRDGKPEGEVQLAARTGGTDDFDVAADGTVYASHGADVVKVTPSGAVSTWLAGGCPSCTAARLSRDGHALYITGGAFPRPGAPPSTPGYVSRVGL